MTGGGCGAITASRRPQAWSAAPARRSKARWSSSAIRRARFFALTVENGRPLWSDSLAAARGADAVSALADIRGRPVIDRGRVFAVSHSGRMVAIDLRSGERVWEQDIGSTHGPWVAGDYVYILSNDNELVCLTRNDGKVRWLRQLPELRGRKGEGRPNHLGRAGIGRRPADRAVLRRLGAFGLALYRRAARAARRCRPAPLSTRSSPTIRSIY